MGLLWEGFYGVIYFGEEGWGGFTLNCMLYCKPVANNKGPFFYVSCQITCRFCRLQNERLYDKLEIGSPPSIMKTW